MVYWRYYISSHVGGAHHGSNMAHRCHISQDWTACKLWSFEVSLGVRLMVVGHILPLDLLAHESPLHYCGYREFYLLWWEEKTSDHWPLTIGVKQGQVSVQYLINTMWPCHHDTRPRPVNTTPLQQHAVHTAVAYLRPAAATEAVSTHGSLLLHTRTIYIRFVPISSGI